MKEKKKRKKKKENPPTWKDVFHTIVAAFLPLVVYKPLQFSADIYVPVVTLQETSFSSYKGDKISANFLSVPMIIHSES